MPVLSRLRNAFRRIFKTNGMPQFPGVAIGEGVILRGADKFYPGTGCSIDVRAYLNCSGGSWNNYSGYIRTGDNCEIGAYCVLWGAGGITLGNNVHLGAQVCISAHELRRDTRQMEFAPVILEDGVLIASNVSISPGVTIGRNSFVAPGSAVVKSIPPDSIASGCPARVFASTDLTQKSGVTATQA